MSIKRLEIPKPIKLIVFKRAGGPGELHCEGCGLPLRGKRFAYDHRFPEYLQTLSPSERTIAEDDVRLLGEDCCHTPKTTGENKSRSKGKRIVSKSAGAFSKSALKKKGRGFSTNRDGPYKKPMYGDAVQR